MTETLPRAAVPPVEPVVPACPICGTDLETTPEDFECSRCEASWPYKTYAHGGTWFEPEAPQCPSTHKPYPNDPHELLAKLEYRCILADDHDGDHGNGEGDDWPGEKAGA